MLPQNAYRMLKLCLYMVLTDRLCRAFYAIYARMAPLTPPSRNYHRAARARSKRKIGDGSRRKSREGKEKHKSSLSLSGRGRRIMVLSRYKIISDFSAAVPADIYYIGTFTIYFGFQAWCFPLFCFPDLRSLKDDMGIYFLPAVLHTNGHIYDHQRQQISLTKSSSAAGGEDRYIFSNALIALAGQPLVIFTKSHLPIYIFKVSMRLIFFLLLKFFLLSPSKSWFASVLSIYHIKQSRSLFADGEGHQVSRSFHILKVALPLHFHFLYYFYICHAIGASALDDIEASISKLMPRHALVVHAYLPSVIFDVAITLVLAANSRSLRICENEKLPFIVYYAGMVRRIVAARCGLLLTPSAIFGASSSVFAGELRGRLAWERKAPATRPLRTLFPAFLASASSSDEFPWAVRRH